MTPQLYSVLADAVLLTHVAGVLFIVLGLLVVLIGALLHWTWVRNFWFRFAHLVAIGIVVVQAWAGMVCPLTTLERWLRHQGGGTNFGGGFIQYWLQRVLYYAAPEWVFVAVYSLFGLLVALSWVLVPPRRRKAQRSVSNVGFVS